MGQTRRATNAHPQTSCCSIFASSSTCPADTHFHTRTAPAHELVVLCLFGIADFSPPSVSCRQPCMSATAWDLRSGLPLYLSAAPCRWSDTQLARHRQRPLRQHRHQQSQLLSFPWRGTSSCWKSSPPSRGTPLGAAGLCKKAASSDRKARDGWLWRGAV